MALISFGKKGSQGADATFGMPPASGFDEPSMAPPPDPSEGPPTDYVISMQKQGLSNSQIIEYLQRQGYEPSLIFEAMNQASVKGNVEMMSQSQDEFQHIPSPNPYPAAYSQSPPPPQRGHNAAPAHPGFDIQGLSSGFDENPSENVERIAEAIIEEKWNELSKHINKIIDWKERTEEKIARMEQQFEDLKKNFDSLHEAILGKVNQYDQNIVHLGVEIKAMEKVFQKILPTLTENVSELSRITKDLKSK